MEQARAALASWPDGRIKMLVLHALLRLRRRCADVHLRGSYEALATFGAHADHLVAFARRHGGTGIVVVAGRLFGTLLGEARAYEGSAWGDTTVAGGPDLAGVWQDALTGASVDLGDGERGVPAAAVLSVLPVAVLAQAGG
jgi:(1->4)-alpha-D-glucan 1-alpha-D-glucosylmutase